MGKVWRLIGPTIRSSRELIGQAGALERTTNWTLIGFVFWQAPTNWTLHSVESVDKDLSFVGGCSIRPWPYEKVKISISGVVPESLRLQIRFLRTRGRCRKSAMAILSVADSGSLSPTPENEILTFSDSGSVSPLDLFGLAAAVGSPR